MSTTYSTPLFDRDGNPRLTRMSELPKLDMSATVPISTESLRYSVTAPFDFLSEPPEIYAEPQAGASDIEDND